MHLCKFLSKLMQKGHPHSLYRYFVQDAIARRRSLSTPKNKSKLMRSNLCVKMSSIRTKSNKVAENNKPLERNSPGKEDGNNGENSANGASSSSLPSMPLTSLVDDTAVSFDKLTTEERSIYRLHKEACEACKVSYIDPRTGYNVMTQHYHITRGKCCGSCCRHCPYSHVNVPEKYRTLKFNTAFFV